jgi:MFS family permease
MSLPRPLSGNYAATLIVALLAITPFILVTTGQAMFGTDLQRIGVNKTAAELTTGFAVAAYAFGALLAGDAIMRFPQRKLFWTCESALVIGCVVASLAQSAPVFMAGVVLLGFATGLLLVVALPPVIQKFPASKMPATAIFINIGFFGAVTAGPLVGGAVAFAHAWRMFYAALALLGLVALVLSALTLDPAPPKNPKQPFDRLGIALGFGATMLTFWGACELTGHSFTSALFIAPLVLGLMAFVSLLLVEFHKDEPLAPIKPMWNTVPICGVLIAMFGGASLVTFMELLQQYELQVRKATPLATGAMFWPEIVGTLIAAGVLGAVLRSRLLLLLPLAGMLVLVAGGVMMWQLSAQSSPAYVLALTGVLGLGAGATVSPALMVSAFALPSKMVGRTFALVELVRSEADYVIAPVLVAVAVAVAGGTKVDMAGLHVASGIALAITIVTTLAVIGIYLSGKVGLPAPNLKAWLERPDENRPAIPSPEVGTAFAD